MISNDGVHIFPASNQLLNAGLTEVTTAFVKGIRRFEIFLPKTSTQHQRCQLREHLEQCDPSWVPLLVRNLEFPNGSRHVCVGQASVAFAD